MRMKGVQGAIAWMKERRLGGDCWVSSGLEGDISVSSIALFFTPGTSKGTSSRHFSSYMLSQLTTLYQLTIMCTSQAPW